MTGPRWPVVTGVLVGAAFGAVGLLSLLNESHDTHPAVVVRWVVGLAVVHDLVLVPIVLLVGLAVHRWARRAWLAGALLVSGSVVLVAWPLVRGYGRQAGNPSVLPRNYAQGLVLVLAVIWLGALATALVLHWRTKEEDDR
jgi:uncharacterized membrane protein YgdD (TMEM256/DUF423 family)